MTDVFTLAAYLPIWILIGFLLDARTNRAQHPNVSVWLLWPVLVIDLAHSHLRASGEINE